jgi:hypothetical protein
VSTYYYIGCSVHRVCLPFWSRSAGGNGLYGDLNDKPSILTIFMEDHEACGLVAFSEHDDRAESYKREDEIA